MSRSTIGEEGEGAGEKRTKCVCARGVRGVRMCVYTWVYTWPTWSRRNLPANLRL
jgi:hypothetical protein